MYSDSLDRLVEETGKIFGGIAEKVSDCATTGKIKLDIFSLKAIRAKAERQIGAYVYKMYKEGIKESEKLDRYLKILDDINKSIEALESIDTCVCECNCGGKCE